jgi:hypothetical protein
MNQMTTLLQYGAALLLVAGTANAQLVNTGYQTCTDGSCTTGACAGEGCCVANGYGACGSNGVCCNGSCNGWACDGNDCMVSAWNNFCTNWCAGTGCGPCAGSGCCLCAHLCQCCATKAAPDAGWNPPARLPVNRDGIWYQNYWPQAWYGNPGGGFVSNYPTVYQPTDTTQLGFSYAKVPTWRPRPGMIPPAPRPSAFHHRACPHPGGNCYQCNTCNQGYAMAAQPGNIHYIVMTQPQTQPAPQLRSVPAPQQASQVQPAVATKSRSRNLFSLTSLKRLFD